MLVVKNLPASAGVARDLGLIPGSGRFLGERHGNPLQYSCLVNPMGPKNNAVGHNGVNGSDNQRRKRSWGLWVASRRTGSNLEQISNSQAVCWVGISEAEYH